MKRLTVVISLYNYKYPYNLKAVIKSIASQSEDVNIIISEQGYSVNPTVLEIAQTYNVKYILSNPDCTEKGVNYNIGRVRNVAASFCETKYIYFTDADVVMLHSEYLSTVMNSLLKHSALFRPEIFRLAEATVPAFISGYLQGFNIYLPDFSNCLVTYDASNQSIIPINSAEICRCFNNIPHVCEKLDGINLDDKFDYSKIEEFLWKPVVHYGGTLCSLEDFWNIGGYCELYHNWGLEDEDLHRKLGQRVSLCYIDQTIIKRSLIHLEHPRNYNNKTYLKNRTIFDLRFSKATEVVIAEDRAEKAWFSYSTQSKKDNNDYSVRVICN